MPNREARKQGDGEVQDWPPGSLGQAVHERHEQDERDIEEDGNGDDQPGESQSQRRTILAGPLQKPVRNGRGTT